MQGSKALQVAAIDSHLRRLPNLSTRRENRIQDRRRLPEDGVCDEHH
jgi:hypothetical protein